MKTPVLIAIPIHSFVDLITNSSTEIYIQAKQKTVDTVKAIVNHLLAQQNSSYTVDDLFDISLVNTTLEDENRFLVKHDKEPREAEYTDEIQLRLAPKLEDEHTMAVAKLFQDMINTFEIDAAYHG